MKKFLLTVLTIILIITPNIVRASGYDFHIESNMEIQYKDGNKYVTVQIEYIREVSNSSYYFPADGNKTFSIPDLSSQTDGQIEVEREFKEDSLSVKDSEGNSIHYTIEKDGEGINIVVPNYQKTTKSSPYKIYITYNTHDYIQVINDNIVIQAPSLSKDTEFEILHEETNTKTEIEYNLEIAVDKEVSNLAKIWPATYSTDENDSSCIYTFSSESRIGQNPYIEFGTSQIFRFELEYITPKTDDVIPERYSNVFSPLSTNIFEISLPRHFDETNQTVKIETISPTLTQIARDDEGNIIATFEVTANKESTISIVGYVWVEQDSYSDQKDIPNLSLDEYTSQISADEDLTKYLTATQYWEVDDEYIQEEADSIKTDVSSLIELIRADYRYINKQLEYDQSKADSINDRIGAKQALQGDSAVCMEYADAMITILRAQGIAARAAIGYTNLKEAPETSESQVRHQWVQIWIPDYGWLSIDPTWESENMDIGPNIHKLLWETLNDNNLSNTKIYSADSLDNIDDIEFNISVFAVEEKDIGELDSLESYEEILPIEDFEEDNSFLDWLNKFIKVSSIGRSIAVVLPIVLVIAFLIFIITVTKSVLKKAKSRKTKSSN